MTLSLAAPVRLSDHVARFLLMVLAALGVLFVMAPRSADATLCEDGWSSPSAGGPGTCSWHGGIADGNQYFPPYRSPVPDSSYSDPYGDGYSEGYDDGYESGSSSSPDSPSPWVTKMIERSTEQQAHQRDEGGQPTDLSVFVMGGAAALFGIWYGLRRQAPAVASTRSSPTPTPAVQLQIPTIDDHIRLASLLASGDISDEEYDSAMELLSRSGAGARQGRDG